MASNALFERGRPHIGVGDPVEGQPAELQVALPALRLAFVDCGLEREVHLVVDATVVGVPVLDDGEQPNDACLGAELLRDLAAERMLDVLTRLDVAAGQKPPARSELAGEQDPAHPGG